MIRRFPIDGSAIERSTIHSTIDNQFDNRQSVDPQSPIDNPPIGNRQSSIANG